MAYRLNYSDYPGSAGPPDPAAWVGPPGPPGPVGPKGDQGDQGVAGNPFPEAPNDGALYGRGGTAVVWSPVLPLTGGALTGPLALAGVSTAPTATPATSTTQIASTAFVTTAVGTATAWRPFLPLTGGIVSGATTLGAGGSLAGTFTGTPTWSGAHTFSATGTALSVTNNATFGGAAAVTLSNGTIAATSGQNLALNLGGSGKTLTVAGTGGTGTLAVFTATAGANTVDYTTTAGVMVKSYFNLVSPTGLVWSGAYSPAKSPLHIGFSPSGTITPVSNGSQYMQWVVSSDTAAIGTGSTINMINIQHNVGGAAMTGNRSALNVSMSQTAKTGNAGGGSIFQAGQATSNCSFNEGGTALTGVGAAGANYAWPEYARLYSGATFFYVNKAKEIGLQIASGASAAKNIGIDVVLLSTHAVQGALMDYAYGVQSQVGSTVGFKTAFQLGTFDGQDPFGSTSAVMRWSISGNPSVKAPQLATGIDLSLGAISGNAFASNNFAVAGSGTTSHYQAKIAQTGSGVSIDIPNYIIGYTSISSGGAGITSGDWFADATSGLIVSATTVSGGVVTVATLQRNGYQSSAPGTVTVTNMNPDRTSQTFVVNASATLNNTLSVQPSGGATVFGGPVTLPAGSTGAFLPLTGGTVTGATTYTSNLVGTSVMQGQAGLTAGTLAGTTGGTLVLQAAAGNQRRISINSGASERWRIGVNNTAEGGGGTNTGSDLFINAYNDAAGVLGTPFAINRATQQTQLLKTRVGGPGAMSTYAGGAPDVNQATFYLNYNYSGSTDKSAWLYHNFISITSDTVDIGPNQQAIGFGAIQYFGGAGITGGRSGFRYVLSMTGAAPANANYQAGLITADASYSSGGTDLWSGAAGVLFGAGVYSALNSGATNYRGTSALEVDYGISTGASAAGINGIQVIRWSTHRFSPPIWELDTAYTIGSQVGALGAKIGFMVGQPNGDWPIDATNGRLIGSGYTASYDTTKPMQAAHGVDFYNVDLTGTALRARGFSVLGSGRSLPVGSVQVGGGYLSSSGATVSLDAVGNVCTGATIASGGANLIVGTPLIHDASGTLAVVTTVSGGAATAISLVANTGSAHVPPANPVTFRVSSTGPLNMPGAPTAPTLTLTWTPSTTLSLQPSGGTVQVGTGCTAANGSVATVLGSLGPAGSHTTVQEWIAIKNASGVTRYIPAF